MYNIAISIYEPFKSKLDLKVSSIITKTTQKKIYLFKENQNMLVLQIQNIKIFMKTAKNEFLLFSWDITFYEWDVIRIGNNLLNNKKMSLQMKNKLINSPI